LFRGDDYGIRKPMDQSAVANLRVEAKRRGMRVVWAE
jgi:hypothetical protein